MNQIFEISNPWRFKKSFEIDLYERKILSEINLFLEDKQILTLIGSRQVGKSSIMKLLIKQLLNKKILPENIYYFNLDTFQVQNIFQTPSNLIDFIGNNFSVKKYVFIDEVQYLENPGHFIKSLYDLNLPIKFILSGSSQLEIKSKIKEFLVGRQRVFTIERFSWDEVTDYFSGHLDKSHLFEEIMPYGTYPAVLNESNLKKKKVILGDIFNDYIKKDIVDFLNIRKVREFNVLMQLLANQTGQLINIQALSNASKLSIKTVHEYLQVLEDTYIIKLLRPFHRNYKKEIIKNPKIYFMDLGLRNFILQNFQDFKVRNDAGILFENFVYLQLIHEDYYQMQKLNFWRTNNQTEVDFIKVKGDKLDAIEVKLSKTKSKSIHSFKTHYPESNISIITTDDYL